MKTAIQLGAIQAAVKVNSESTPKTARAVELMEKGFGTFELENLCANLEASNNILRDCLRKWEQQENKDPIEEDGGCEEEYEPETEAPDDYEERLNKKLNRDL